jgi:phage tail tape-measure protein
MNTVTDVYPIPHRGGARPNSGPKRKKSVAADPNQGDAESGDSYAEYSKARARSEAAKADLAELDYRVKSGQYVSRAAVRQACATAYSTIAQVVRSIPDLLERSAGITPAAAAAASIACDNALSDLSTTLEMLSGDE